MGLFDRLGNVINSFFDGFSEQSASRFRSSSAGSTGDPDLDAAYEELNDYLNRKGETVRQNNARSKLPPEELRADFECLGVPFGANAEVCKAAYKKLLKVHHPDRHAGHEGNFKKATAKSAKINAAWDRINKYWEVN